MKIIKIPELAERKKLTAGRPSALGDPQFVQDILTREDKAEDINGLFISYPPQTEGIYHYHKKCESLMLVISGKGFELVEGKEFPLEPGDVVYIPAGEKHAVVNRSDAEFRFLEFHTTPPVSADKFRVE